MFMYNINKSLIYNNCFTTKKIFKNDFESKLIDNDIAELIKKYQSSLKILNNQDNINKIEEEIKTKSNIILQKQQQNFIDKAHHYDNNNLEKQLFSHLNSNDNKDAVIKYKDKTLFSDTDIIKHSINFYNDLYGDRKPLNNNMDNIEQNINQIIDESYDDDEKIENIDFTSDELNEAIKHFKVSKASGLDQYQNINQ